MRPIIDVHVHLYPAGTGTIGEIVAQVETFGLSEGTVGKILSGNARGLLRRLEME